MAWLRGTLASQDLEQRLVFDLDRARAGQEYDKSYERPQSVWYTEDKVLMDLVGPLTAVAAGFG